MRRLKTIFACMLMAVLSIGQVWGADVTGTINFGSASGNTNVNAASVTGDDSQGNTWTVTTAGTTSFTPNPAYAQIGSSKKPATSVTFTTTLAAEQTISAFSASFGGFSSTAGTVTLKVGETTVGTGFLNATNDVTVSATKTTAGTVLTVEVTGIAKGVKAYSISYTYSTGGGDPDPSVTVDPEDWDFGAVATDASASKVFSVSGSNLTAGTLTLTAPSGYSVSPASITVASAGDLDATNVTVSKNTSTAGTYNGNLTISGCGLEDDVEVALAMEVKAKYTVTWNNNGVTSTSQVLDGEKPVFPATPASCDATSTTFIGWATAPWTGKLANLDDKTVYTKAADMPAVGAAVTYYAVFAKSSGSAGNLLKWEGGTSSALTALENVTASGLGSDYAATNAPYRVKFDTEGDYIVITTSGAIESVAVGVKMLGGGSTSHIYVQEAEDAESDFSAVETLTISGAQNDVIDLETENAFKADSRAVKLLFNKGSNVGVGPITIAGAASASDYMTTCCTKYAVNIAAGIEHGSISADLASACEGATVTLTFTPATNYHLSGWTLNGVAQDVNANTFSMPAGAATVSATFEQDACDPLATPVVTVSGKAYPYNAVKLAWSAITNADSYKVYIYDAEDNELEHDDAFTGLEYTIGQTLSGSTTYKYSVQAISNTPATYCPSEAATGSFDTEALPTAHLTLIALGEEHASSGDYAILTPFNLPATAAACSKAFVGWDADPDCATAPTYAKGAEFTFPNTTGVTLYAVYADELTPGTTSYVKTEFASLASGDNVVVTMDNGTGIFAMSNNEFVSNKGPKAVEVTVAANAITSTVTDAIVWDITFDESNFTLTVHNGTNKLYCLNDNNGLRVGTEENNVFSINSAYIHNNGQARFIGVYQSGDWRSYGSINANIKDQTLAFYKKTISEGTYGNYSTACVASPTATPASASIEVAATGGSSTLGVTYENVNLANVAVALYNNEACTEAFDGGWLTASIAGDDKHIAYTAQENTTSYVARTAYIKLTAPETSGAADPAVVVIPVTQAKYIPVFANLAALVEANVPTGTEVTVTFDEVITGFFTTSQDKKKGIYLTTEAADKAIEIYYSSGDEVVPDGWKVGGKASATAKTFTWTYYTNNAQWELVPSGTGRTWEGDDFVTYTAPKEVSSVVVSGGPAKTTYVDGELFKPAGLTVTVNYTVGEPEVNPVGVTFACTPERVAKGNTSVEVVATFNEVDSDPFEVTGLTVGDIQLMSIADFIAAGGARCYLEGVVGTIDNNTYGNFNLTDASGTIYVYGCLTPAGESGKFNTLGVSAGDKIKVIAEEYLLYGSPAYDEAKNVVFVSKKPVATMTFNPMELETGDVETMAPATITLAEASAVSYSIKDGSDDCVELDGAQITATAPGSATIVATLTEAADYMGTTVEFAVTVTAPDTRLVANGSAFAAISGDLTPADIKYTAYKGDGTTNPAINNNNIRLYKPDANNNKTTGGYLKLTALMGYKIDQVQITFNGNATASYAVDDAAFSTEAYITGQTSLLTPASLDAQSVSIVNLKDGSIDVNAIKVWYTGSPLAIHHYFLGGTYETEFEQYSQFNHAGLQVFAAYDELETISEEIFDFTVQADLNTAGAKKAEVYRNEVKIAEYDINVTASAKENPALAYDPTSATLTLGESLTAPTFSNPFNVEGISYNSSKPSVATVDAEGNIALAGGCGVAVITASFAENDDYIASEATFTITVNEPAEDLSGTWVVASSVEVGDRIIIADVAAAGAVKTLGAQANNGTGNNRVAVASTVDEYGILTPANGTKTFLVVATETAGQYALKALNGNYLYAASNSSNHLKEEASVDENGNANWTIEIDANGIATIKAQGNNNVNWIRYNGQSNVFSCYGATNSQADVVIYKVGTPNYGSYQRNVTNGNYGTICLPKAGTIEGAMLYNIGSYENGMIYVDEAGTTLEAGKPYIFQATANQLNVTYTSATVVETAGSANGLFGFYNLNDEDAQKNLDQNDGNYILYQNQYWLVSGRAAYIANYRAYIKISAIQNAQPAPGIRRVAMQVNGQNTTTGVDNLNAGETPVKVMINGQMFILRGEKMYNANGQLVK